MEKQVDVSLSFSSLLSSKINNNNNIKESSKTKSKENKKWTHMLKNIQEALDNYGLHKSNGNNRRRRN